MSFDEIKKEPKAIKNTLFKFGYYARCEFENKFVF